MVICPWCGTSYANFQSNCQRCGGPLTTADQETVRVPRRSAAGGPAVVPEAAPLQSPPPPPPRPISSDYALRLLFGDGWVISALVFVLIGGIFFVVGVSLTVAIITAFVGIPFVGMGLAFLVGGGAVTAWRYQAATQLAEVVRMGQAATARIERVEENYNVRVNGRNPWTITYSFQVSGRDFTGQVTTLHSPGPAVQAGKMAYVLYLPADPKYNSLYPHP
jgi:hypothetical protein